MRMYYIIYLFKGEDFMNNEEIKEHIIITYKKYNQVSQDVEMKQTINEGLFAVGCALTVAVASLLQKQEGISLLNACMISGCSATLLSLSEIIKCILLKAKLNKISEDIENAINIILNEKSEGKNR